MNEELIQKAINLAQTWQDKAHELVSEKEAKFHKQMKKLLANPKDKNFLLLLLDQSFRANNQKRVANQIKYLFDKYGVAEFFSSSDKFLIWLFLNFGGLLPDVSVPLFIKTLRDEVDTMVIKGEEQTLKEHLQKRKSQKDRVNINLIGEAVLGQDESEERIQKYIKALRNPDIDYVSIKISTIFSQINPLSMDDTVNELISRLSRIYKVAKENKVEIDGKLQNKFVNLDMEEYRDLAITYEAFTKTLQKEEFKDIYAGIVLQAYLPDSFLWQEKLTAWAKTRVENGGNAVKIRIVKGANMEMEELEKSLRHWELAPYSKKIDTDSNYKRMVEFGLNPENIKAVHIATASHNLFEQAYAYTLAEQNGVLENYSIEMLEGMSESARLAIKELNKSVLLYAPVAAKEQFTNAIAYLVRRFDENTSDENFIRYSFGLKVGSDDWEREKQKFIDSFKHKSFVGSHRNQDRSTENWDDYKGGSFFTKEFKNEADTDFVLPQNQKWAKQIIKDFKKESSEEIIVPVVVNGKELKKGLETKDIIDKSQNLIIGKIALAGEKQLKEAIKVAKDDEDGWRAKTYEQRHEILAKVANNFRQRRNVLIGTAAAEVGKVFTETDVEVSEAIDFLEFYPHSFEYFKDYEVEFSPRGVGLVVPPWNFPVAIPTGGVTAALSAGNTVILKPASAAANCAYELCKCFWDAGVSKKTLQFVPSSGKVAGEHLIPSEDIDFVILTGGEDTAKAMFEAKPSLYLSAETGGKDATIVTAMSDRDQAIKNILHSAFSNSGQKCSATSLLVLEEEVYDDELFKKTLIDAVKSMEVGSVWDLKNKIGTLSDEPSGSLKQAIESLEDGEIWAIKPQFANDNKYMLKPAIKWGVKRGNFCHLNELFGPVLSVIKARDLSEAIDIVNETGYGLTSGLESLDDREIKIWKENIKAGNIYINRGTTGAIVLRQPFGGVGKSAIGAGRKAGFYNYVTLFTNIKETNNPKNLDTYENDQTRLIKEWQAQVEKGIYVNFAKDFELLQIAAKSYLKAYNDEFSQEKDYCKVRGEDNIFKYKNISKVIIRVLKDDTLLETLGRIIAAKTSKVSFIVSIEADLNNEVALFLFEQKDKFLSISDEILRQNEDDFIASFDKIDRILFANPQNASEKAHKAASSKLKYIIRQPFLLEGRFELLNFFEEQSISHSYHRYGNLGERGQK